MTEPGWGVGHAGPKLRAEKNPGQVRVGRGTLSVRRKEKKSSWASLENLAQEGLSLNKIFSITRFNSWIESNSNLIQSLNEFYTYSNSKHPRIQNKMQAA
jgi:hypothetical protein